MSVIHFRTLLTNCSARLNSPTSGKLAVEPGLLILRDIAGVENIGPTRLAAGVIEPRANGLSGFFLLLYLSIPVRQIFYNIRYNMTSCYQLNLKSQKKPKIKPE